MWFNKRDGTNTTEAACEFTGNLIEERDRDERSHANERL